MRKYLVFLPLLAALALSGCASYTPMPLPKHARTTAAVSLLTMPATAFETPGVHNVRVDPDRPLNADALAALAVLNDPSLVALRARRGVAMAQSYAAGLMPWPQVTLGAGHPAPMSPGLSNTWSLALDQDVAAWLQHHSRQAAAAAKQEKVRLDVIWDEWQVAQRARLLYADIEMLGAERAAVEPLAHLYEDQYKAATIAVRNHALAQSAALEVQAARAAIIAQLGGLAARQEKDKGALYGLLGLDPNVPLSLVLDDHPAPPDGESVKAAIVALPNRRPDLMALAAAYGAEDQRLRQAVLAQFPLIGIDIHRKRDTEGVAANGLSLTFELPFLNGARGAVAEARASRAALHASYQARLDAAASGARTMEHQVSLLAATLRALSKSLSQLPGVSKNTELGQVSFNLTAAYARARMQLAVKTAEAQHSLDVAAIALDTLLGMPLDRGSHVNGAPE